MRQRLENRRPSETFSLEVAGLRYTATIGRFPDGTISEIFLSNTKPSSQSDVNARDAGVAASLAFQHGCSIDELRRALLRDRHGNASSPLGAALDKIGGVP
jgi:ribonucleoside-diphosphate reductase alpha chain